MNFELSLTLVWLVLFDVLVFLMMVKRGSLFKDCKWGWILFPLWLTVSVIWSLNSLRGILTAGMVWCLVFAGYGIWNLRDLLVGMEFRRRFLKWLFGSTFVVCIWCLVQCVMDLAGVEQCYSLLCDGCTYHMFGFPHPNGFAIEPQFMGNLLLAPMLVTIWLYVERATGEGLKRERLRSREIDSVRGAWFLDYRLLAVYCFVIGATLFLTFSRGAIYAFAVAMIFMTVAMVVKEKNERREMLKRFGVMWGIVTMAFLFTLNLQGIMAEVSQTDDTYETGVAKVVNHLSLGVIEIEGEGNHVVENSVENSEEKVSEKTGEKAVFDGYVAESTDTRLRLASAGVEVWRKDARTILFGVGLGGAGQALYNNGLSPAPKEIVQNEYASLLLETGLIGVLLFVILIILVVRTFWRSSAELMLFSVMVAYGVTLLFFSGIPNALQIVIIPVILFTLSMDKVNNHKDKRKKLVS